MLNVIGFYRKKNTFIYLLILSISLTFLFYFNHNINLLNFNKKEYNNYFIVKNIPNEIYNKDSLLIEKCFLIDNKIITIDDNLKNNEMVLAYSFNEKNEFIVNNSFSIIKYGETTLISSEKFKALEEKYESNYRIYLKEIEDYENYNNIINNSLFHSISLDLQEAKRDIKFFKGFAKIISVIIVLMIIALIYSIINDNHKYNRMLKLLGYTKVRLLYITLVEILSLCLMAVLLSIFIFNLLKCFI